MTARAERVRDVLAASGIEAVLTADVQAALWAKFTFIAAISGVCAAGRLPMGPVLRCAETRTLYVEALREIEAVARAQAVNLPETVVADTLQLSEGFPAATKPSMLVDLEAGRRLELEALNGAVVRRGGAAGVETPVHRVFYSLLLPWAT